MTEVSTRPRKGATTVAKTATPVTFSATPVAAPAPVEDDTAEIASLQATYAAIATLLEEAEFVELAIEHSGDSNRLLRAAAEYARSRTTFTDFDALTNDAWTVAAMMRASRTVPGDQEPAERARLIAQVGALICPIVGSPIEQVIEPYPVDFDNTPGSAVVLTDARRQLAFDANHQIEWLAGVLKDHVMKGAHDDWPVHHGILGRIQQLCELVHLAACLSGDDYGMGYPGDEALRMFLDGRLELRQWKGE